MIQEKPPSLCGSWSKANNKGERERESVCEFEGLRFKILSVGGTFWDAELCHHGKNGAASLVWQERVM